VSEERSSVFGLPFVFGGQHYVENLIVLGGLPYLF